MTTYYVRKTGVDTNAGTSPSTAFLTIGKALTVMVAGDITYVGAGIYRENGLNPTNSGSSGSPITIKGDLDGSQTGDAGIVRVTASADDNAYTNSNVFNMSKNYITLDSLWCDFSSNNCINSSGSNNIVQNCWVNYTKGNGINLSGNTCSVINCRVRNGIVNGTIGISLTGGEGVVDSCIIDNIQGGGNAFGITVEAQTSYVTLTVKNCIVRGVFPNGGAPDCGIYAQMNNIASAVLNCYNNTVECIYSGGANDAYGIYINNVLNSQTLNIYNNDIRHVLAGAGTNDTYAIAIDGTQAQGTAVLTSQAVTSVTMTNDGNGYKNAPTVSFSGGGGTGAAGTAVLNGSGQVTSVTITAGGSGYTSVPTVSFQTPAAAGIGATVNGNYNMWSDCRDGVSGYVAGSNDKANNAINILVPPLPQGNGYPLGYYLDTSSGGYDAGTTNSGSAPTVDIMKNPRQGAFGQDIGAIEKQGNIVKDTTTYNTAAPATRIDGCGYIDFEFAINNAKTATISAYIKTNSSYSGTQPSLTVQTSQTNTNQSGTVSYTGVSNAWQQVIIPTASMLANANGVCVVRFQTYSTAAGSSAWIDDITITEA